jgi:hypothetical protein
MSSGSERLRILRSVQRGAQPSAKREWADMAEGKSCRTKIFAQGLNLQLGPRAYADLLGVRIPGEPYIMTLMGTAMAMCRRTMVWMVRT